MKNTKKAEWKALIQMVKTKIERSQVKTAQLQAVLADFQIQSRRGEPCPTDIDAFRDVPKSNAGPA